MASNYTSNYQLCQWQEDDKVLRTEFNADNAKIDAAIAAVDSRVDGKASSSALNSLKTTVNGKADKTALEALKTTVTQHTAALVKAGNCQIYAATYTGTGLYGSDNRNSHTFPHKPVAVFLAGEGIVIPLFQGVSSGYRGGAGERPVNAYWSGNTLQWYAFSAADQQNKANTTYHVIALLDAAN